ncbi:MAG: hypothetical protein J0L57_00780 [Burkholderiales bacterium]|nr:hypothetical protein [Burkholderiales bacterium]
MAAHRNVGAATPGPVTPTSDNARVVPGVIGVQGRGSRPDFRYTLPSLQPRPPADQAEAAVHMRLADKALAAIKGEQYARAYLARLQAGMASPGELAVIVGFLRDEMLHGACRVIEKALGVRHV